MAFLKLTECTRFGIEQEEVRINTSYMIEYRPYRIKLAEGKEVEYVRIVIDYKPETDVIFAIITPKEFDKLIQTVNL